MRFEKWNVAGFNRAEAEKLCTDNENPLNPLIAVLLSSRGITGRDDINALLYAGQLSFADPYLLTDMDKAVNRISQAVDNNEIVAIYGDYDVDGMTSAALLARFFDTKGTRYEIYIPGRFDEGYGLHSEALNSLKKSGVSLVITVDCGITAENEAQYAKDIGLDLIITDHHECKNEIPDAIAVVNPKRAGCAYPYDSLAGVGVVFKLICALEKGNFTADELFDRYGQLVAVGTVADVMPVLGENRMMILRGLELINKKPEPGLQGLIDESYISDTVINTSTISYTLAPRLNAAGRMGESMLSVRLLLSRDNAEARKYASQLCALNEKRRELELGIYDTAVSQLGKTPPAEPIILAGEGWHQGVTGIIAAKLADRYKLPAIVISIDKDNSGHGSCRSVGTYSIYEALSTCEDILENFGGHNMAAGITINPSNIGELKKRVINHYRTNITEGVRASLEIDFEVEKPRLLTLENVEKLCDLEPFGRGNPTACLCMKGVTLTDLISIGAGKHTKLKIEKNSYVFDCIFFSASPDEMNMVTGDIVDVAFEPQINSFRDKKSVQLQLADIRNVNTLRFV